MKSERPTQVILLRLLQRHNSIAIDATACGLGTLDLSATELFRRFQQGTSHFAVVSWKDDHPAGFITMDNMLGALVGEIRDEFREVGNDWTTLDDGSLLGKGSLPIFTLERALGLEVGTTEVEFQ